MIKRLMRRTLLLILAFALVGAAFVRFQNSTAHAQEAFDIMCELWGEYCDEGSGGGKGGDGGGGGGGGGWLCPDSQTCGNFGCHARSIADPTQICSRYKIGDGPGTCPSPVNCTRVNF